MSEQLPGDKGLLIVLSGPSGAGKDTIIRALMREVPELHYSVSATTRSPRPDEKDGVDYYFVSQERFRAMIDEGGLLEWAGIYGYFYGTPRAAVERQLAANRDIILKLDVQGGAQVRKGYPEGVFIFIVPPLLSELRRRIEARGSETPAMLEKRYRCAVDEIRQAVNYDYIVVNDDLEQAVAEIKAIITAEKLRTARRWPAHRSVLLSE
ncbi:MAG: guanylate kinase [bacterium]